MVGAKKDQVPQAIIKVRLGTKFKGMQVHGYNNNIHQHGGCNTM